MKLKRQEEEKLAAFWQHVDWIGCQIDFWELIGHERRKESTLCTMRTQQQQQQQSLVL
jgi:hypothetical protein